MMCSVITFLQQYTSTCPFTQKSKMVYIKHKLMVILLEWQDFWMNLIKKKLVIFWNSFRFIEKLQRQYREFPNTQHLVFPIINMLCQYGICVVINEARYMIMN